MNSLSEDYIKQIITTVATCLKYSTWDHSLQNFESIGQNYFGLLVPVILSGKVDGTSCECVTHLVLKLAPTDERYRVSGAIMLMFAREIYLYSMLLKQYQLQEQTLNLPKFISPKCYYTCNDYCKEALALEDMGAKGYKPYTHTMFLDLNHITAALKSLAYFHAHSIILRDKNSKLYEEAAAICVPLTQQTNQRYMEVMHDRITKAKHKFSNTTYANIFEKMNLNYINLIEATSKSVEHTCICHGDMWKENILFKNESKELVSACLIDYQTARVCSPAYDVLYLIATSTDSILRRQHFQDLLSTYHQQLDEVLKQAGLQIEQTLSRSSFDKDLKTVAPSCIVVANTALWLACGLQREGHVRSKLVWDNDEQELAAVENYKNTIRGIIDDFNHFMLLSSYWFEEDSNGLC